MINYDIDELLFEEQPELLLMAIKYGVECLDLLKDHTLEIQNLPNVIVIAQTQPKQLLEWEQDI